MGKITSIESTGHILANTTADQGDSTRMILDECTDIVDDTSDEDQWSCLGLFLKLFELHDGQPVEGDSPVEFCTPLIEFLLLLLQHSLLNFIV